MRTGRPKRSETVRPTWETTKYFLITNHYKLRDSELRWDVNRYRRLCDALRLTEEELAAYIRVSVAQIHKATSRNVFPPTVELHLTLIERSVFPTAAPPLFPLL